MKIIGRLLERFGFKEKVGPATLSKDIAATSAIDRGTSPPTIENRPRDLELTRRAFELAVRQKAFKLREKDVAAKESAIVASAEVAICVGEISSGKVETTVEKLPYHPLIHVDALSDQPVLWQVSEAPPSEVEFRRGLKYLDEASASPVDPAPAYRDAFDCFKRAAENGHPEAALEVALSYACGRGVQKYLDEARSYFLKAAEGGSRRAQYAVGLLMMSGGSIFDKSAAGGRFWIERAARADYAPAVNLLKRKARPSSLQLVPAQLCAGRSHARPPFLGVPSPNLLPLDEQERFRSLGWKVGQVCSSRTMQGKKISPVFDDRAHFEGRATAIAERRGYLDMYSTSGMGDVDETDPLILACRTCCMDGVHEGISAFFDDH